MNIFLIEDNDVYRMALNRLLQTCTNYSISSEFTDGTSFVSSLNNVESESAPFPDLILLDLYLPDMNGWDILDVIQQKELPTPVIIISQSSSKSDIIRSKNYPNVVGYFIKSNFPADLFDMIHELDPSVNK
jgi:CheY-like chemotaxis protein